MSVLFFILFVLAVSMSFAAPTTTKPAKRKTEEGDPPEDVESSWYEVLKAYDGDGVELKVGELVELEVGDNTKSLVDLKFLKPLTDEDLQKRMREKSVTETRAAILGIVHEAVNEAFNERFSNDGGTETSPSGRKARGVPQSLRVEGMTDLELQDPLLGFKSTGHFINDLRRHCVVAKSGGEVPSMKAYIGRLDRINKAVGDGQLEAIGEDGGVLIPAQMSNNIYQHVFENNPLLSKCDRYSIRGNAITFPRFIEESRKDVADGGSRNAGVIAGWIGEGQALDVTRLGKLGTMAMRLHKLGALAKMTSEMMEDGGGIVEQWLTRKLSEEIAFQLGLAFWEGDGVGKPIGAFNANNKGQILLARNTATKVLTEDIYGIMGAVLATAWTRGMWFINQYTVATVLPQLIQYIKNVAGTENVSGYPLWSPPGTIQNSPFGSLLGRTIMPLEFNGANGTKGDVAYADFGQYAVLTKGASAGNLPAVNMSMSIHLFFDQDATAFKATYRVDGQPWKNYKIQPFRGGATEYYSDFVMLNT